MVCKDKELICREHLLFYVKLTMRDSLFLVALGSFVADVVHIFYDSDKMVQEDEEIQAFVKDVCSFGMQDFDYCGENKLFTVLCS